MAQSECSNKTRSVLSYHDAIWQISWGETSTISDLREEMSKAIQQESWLSKSSWQNSGGSLWRDQMQSQKQGQYSDSSAASLQLPGFKTIGLMMTRIAGTQCQMPALLLAAQTEPRSAANVNAVCARGPPGQLSSTCARKQGRSVSNAPARSKSDSGPQAKTTDSMDADGPSSAQAVTLETFDGELPSVGSEGHFDGSCKRCAFFPKGRCRNGKDCCHCHFSHELRPRTRKRNARKQTDIEENISGQGIVPDEEISDDSVLSEVLSYLSEPAATLEETNKISDDEKGMAMVTKLNTAVQEVAETYIKDFGAHTQRNSKLGDLKPATVKYGHITDAETTSSSVSSFSDSEDTVNVSRSDSREGNSQASKSMLELETQTDTSDSEIASQQKPTAEVTVADRGGLEQNSSHRDKSGSGSTLDELSLSPSHQSSQEVKDLGHPSTADIMRMTRSLLNKLTHERFESLCTKILALPLSTPEQLAVVVAEIFQKATTQDFFRNLYTELCMRLDAHLASHNGSIGGKAFRKALVNECQVTFEYNLKPPDASLFAGLDSEERFEVEMKLKTRRLGNMRFIGDLLVRRLLAPKLLPPIVHELLHSDEAALESAIALLAIVAPEFEMKPSLYQAPVRDALSTLRRKVNDKAVSTRLRCQINDLLDAKARAWAPRSLTSEP